MPRNPNCELCELHTSSRNVCIWGDGDGEAFVIGEAPGKAEAKTGKPFMGESGQLLRQILKEHGLSDAYITNVAKCRPPDNRKPEPSEMAACRPYLNEEIATRKPKAILLLGAVAMKGMLHRTSITEMNGQVVTKDGQTFVCSFHPAYILRDPSKMPGLKMAIGRYAAVMAGTNEVKLPSWRLIHKDTLDEFLREWIAASAVSYDIETTGLEWWAEGFQINSIAFSLRIGDLQSTWALTLAKWSIMPFQQQRELLLWLTGHCEGKIVVGQNGKWDNLCLLAVYDLCFPETSDTMLAHHLIDENSAHGLKILAREHCGAPDYDLSLKEKKGNTTRTKLLGYNSADSHYTLILEPKFKNQMDKEERWLYEKVIIPASRALTRAEHNGLYVDLEQMEKVAISERQLVAKSEADLKKAIGKDINWNKPADVSEVLYGQLGLTPTVFTDKGFASTAEAALVDLDHPVVKLLEEYRKHQKFLSTYIDGWKELMVGPHLYLSWKMTGTVTGRYSSRLHSIPRDSTIRSLITAPKGWTFCQLDLSQAELRRIAIVAPEPEMLRCFKTGIDIHWRTLMGILGSGGSDASAVLSTVQKFRKQRNIQFPDALDILATIRPKEAEAIWSGWKEERKKAKGVNFGFAYGQGAEGFIDYAKAKYDFEPTLIESHTFRDAFFHTYPGITTWHERQKKLVRKDGFVRNGLGRKRRLPGIYSRDRFLVGECERMGINAPIQSFIGDYKAMIMVELDEEFSYEEFRLVGEQHDSILSWIRTDRLDEILPEVKRIGDHPRLADELGLEFPIPFIVDIEVGPWGAGTVWKE